MRTILGNLSTSETALKFFDASLKITVLLAGLLLAVAAMRWLLNVSAARRASVLWLGVVAIPAIAATSFVGSSHRAALIRFPVPRVEAAATATSIDPAETPPAGRPPIGRVIDKAATASQMPSAVPDSPVVAVEEKNASPTRGHRWLIGIWLGGIALVALRLCAGILTLDRRALSRSRRTERGRTFDVMAGVAKELGLRRIPELRLAPDRSTMPMTWGARRHRIVLPAVANEWTRERLRLVLQHELSHVKRRDCAAAWTMRLLLAPAWFNPLAWLVARQANDLRERACDDAVAKLDGDIDRYAHALVDLSRGYRGMVGAVAMARPQRLRARIIALYCPHIGRAAATGKFRGSAIALLALCVIPMCLFSACQTTDVTPEAEKPSESKSAHTPTEPKMVVTPKPVFRKGEKKVALQAIELTLDGNPSFREKAALSAYAKGKPNAIPAADLADLEKVKGADLMSMAPFPTGRTHKFKIAREFMYPLNPEADPIDHKMTSRDVGLMGDALVKPLANGKLSVDINVQVVEFEGFKTDAAGVQRPEFAVRKIQSHGPMTIENGGGISPFLVREDVQHTVDKVPFLGDVPLIGRLFRREAESHFRRMLLLRVRVTDP